MGLLKYALLFGRSRYKQYPILFLVIVGFACYANVLHGEFFFDDEDLITNNAYIKAFDIKKIYTSHLIEGANRKGNFYRPHQAFVIAVTWKLFGKNPLPFHLIGVVFHILNAVLLFFLFKKIRLSKGVSSIGAMLWLVHPVHTEAVSFISGFHDPVSFCLCLSGIHFFLRAHETASIKPYAVLMGGALFAFVNALFFKESMVIFGPLVFLTGLYYYPAEQFRDKRIWISLSFIAILTIVYLYLKFSVFNFWEGVGLSDGKLNPYTQSVVLRLSTFVNILREYLKLVFWPLHLNFYKPYAAYSSILTFRALPGLLLILGLVISMFWFNKEKGWFFGSSWFFAALIPYSGLVALKDMYLEHWLYVPLVGIIFLILLLFKKIPSPSVQRAFLIIGLALIPLCAARTIDRNRDWSGGERFYHVELKLDDDKCRAHINLAQYYLNRNRFEDAIQNALQSARYLKPEEIRGAFVYSRLGLAYLKANRLNEAENAFYCSLEYNPNFRPSLYYLIRLYQQNGMGIKAMMAQRLLNDVLNGKRIEYKYISSIKTIIEN